MYEVSPEAPVAVIGAGAMGAGIAQVAAQAGHAVWLYDLDAQAVEKGRAGIAASLDRQVARGKITQAERISVFDRIRTSISLADLRDARLVIEAIVERLDVKQALFREIEAIVGPETILATNTSSLSVTAIAQALQNPRRFAGLHFFNPAPAMQLVEVVSGLASDPALLDSLCEIARAWGKQPVRCRSTPGFIVNRVARPFYAEALRLFEEGTANVPAIDHILRESGRFRMGPFELMDLIGHDVNFAVTSSVFDAYFTDPRYRPSLVQQELVDAGWLGRKSGRGFYRYDDKDVTASTIPVVPGPLPAKVLIQGDLGMGEVLVARLAQAGVDVVREPGEGVLQCGEVLVAFSDGRTATERAESLGVRDVVLLDLAFDYATTPLIAIARSDQSSEATLQSAAAALAAAGISAIAVDDAPGLVVMRTVCMLANEAAEAILQGVAGPSDIDMAMRKGVNFPLGPCAWAHVIGLPQVVRVLDAIFTETGDDRYRTSRHLRRVACSGGNLLAPARLARI